MKIVAVCGMGIGTSVLLKMNAEKVLAQLGIEAVGGTSQQFADFAQAEINKWTKVVGEAKIPKEN